MVLLVAPKEKFIWQKVRSQELQQEQTVKVNDGKYQIEHGRIPARAFICVALLLEARVSVAQKSLQCHHIRTPLMFFQNMRVPPSWFFSSRFPGVRAYHWKFQVPGGTRIYEKGGNYGMQLGDNKYTLAHSLAASCSNNSISHKITFTTASTSQY